MAKHKSPVASRAMLLQWTPESGNYFIWTGIFFGMALGSASGLVDFLTGITPPTAMWRWSCVVLYIVLAVGFGFGVKWIYGLLQRSMMKEYQSVPVQVEGLEEPEGKRGLVLLVSPGGHRYDNDGLPANLQTQRKAIQHHLSKGTLNRVWLVHSGNQEEYMWPSVKCAVQLQEEFADRLTVILKYVNDISEPWEVMNTVKEIYETERPQDWQPGDIIADYTGMTKSASIGMVLACLDPDRPIQYTPQRKDAEGEYLDVPPYEIKIEWSYVLVPKMAAKRKETTGRASA